MMEQVIEIGIFRWGIFNLCRNRISSTGSLRIQMKYFFLCMVSMSDLKRQSIVPLRLNMTLSFRDLSCLTWPAGPGDGFLDSMLMNRTYTANQINAQMTIAPAQELFLHLFSLNKKVHVVVHSMGHQIVLPALASISENLSRPAITELVLNAPDFPEREFKNVAPALVKSAQRVTLYCSPADNALIASEKLNGSRRIGMCAKVSGIDTINVNEIDSPALGIGGLGHGYYAGRPVIADLYQVLLGVEANRRLFIRVSRSPSENYVLRR